MKSQNSKTIHGIVVIDKPEGISSFGAVKRIQRLTGARKAGHTGTLDPLATGVLPICLNEATKIVRFLIDQDKEYSAVMTLGIETDTGDREGRVVKERSVPALSRKEVVETLESFVGRIKQIPPHFSAKKKDGIPLYRLARRGFKIELDPVEVTIFHLEYKEMKLPHIAFDLRCSKGTYIRALARDIGLKLGCGAHLRELRRTRCGPFGLDRSCGLDQFRESWETGMTEGALWLIEEAVNDWPSIVLDDGSLQKIRHGLSLNRFDLHEVGSMAFKEGDYVSLLSSEGRLVAIGKAVDGLLAEGVSLLKNPIVKPVRLFFQ
jgi:tRNA pseudouridine55 synthase